MELEALDFISLSSLRFVGFYLSILYSTCSWKVGFGQRLPSVIGLNWSFPFVTVIIDNGYVMGRAILRFQISIVP